MSRGIDENKMNYSDQYDHLQSSSQKLSRCRVCLEERNDLQNLFSSTKMNYASKIEQCALVDVREDDGFPQNICVDCIKLLESAHKFKILCEQSNQTLKLEALNHVEIKIENEFIIENYTSESSTTVKFEAQSNDNDGDSNFGIFDDVNTDLFDDEIDESDSLDNSDRLDPKYATEEVNVSTVPKKPKKSRKPGEVKIKVPRPSQKLQCDECEYETIVPNNLENHKRTRHQGILDFYKCEHCPKGFPTRRKLKGHFFCVHDKSPIACETCGKTFKNKRLLYSHNFNVHVSVRKHRCDYCTFMARSMHDLKKHQKNLHTENAKEHPCMICKKVYKTQYSLSTHIDRVHKKIRSFKCDECDKSFFTSSELRQHKLIHSGLKPYICLLCPGIAYTWYSALIEHNTTSHPGNKLENESSMYKRNMANRTEQNS